MELGLIHGSRTRSVLPFDDGVERFHHTQEVRSARSRVHPISWGSDPLVGVTYDPSSIAASWMVDRATRATSSVAALATLLEAAYGYEDRPDHPRGSARRAPSAGALYPTELFVLAEREGCFTASYYAFERRTFHHALAVDASAAARALQLGRGDIALVAAAVFWRSVQRYGVRGYRYCLLDAAHVTWNLATELRASGFEGAPSWVPASMALSRAMALPSSVGVVGALVIHGSDGLRPVAHLPRWNTRGSAVHCEEPRALSPGLRRVVAFHARTLTTMPRSVDLPWTIRLSHLPERRSAKAFGDTPLPADACRALVHSVKEWRPLFEATSGALSAYGLRIRVDGAPAGVERITSGGPEPSALRDPIASSPERLASQLRHACENQALAGESAYALVLGVRRSTLQASSPSGYRDLILEVGLLTAELYAVASRLAVGTTVIGGFHDRTVSQLVDDDELCPIAVQVFGEPSTHLEKHDATSVAWTT